MTNPTTDYVDRFWSKVDVGLCWEWTGYRDAGGYGQFRLGGRLLKAHRAAWLLLVGEIPEGMELDHLCRNRGCVNPDHLEPVTSRENSRRARSGEIVGFIKATRTHCYRGHSYDERGGVKSNGSRRCLECARLSNAARLARQR